MDGAPVQAVDLAVMEACRRGRDRRPLDFAVDLPGLLDADCPPQIHACCGLMTETTSSGLSP